MANHVVKRPNQAAIVEDELTLTWGDLDQTVSMVAEALWSHHVGNGDAVAIVLPNCPSFVIAFLALARIGAVAVPISPDLKEPEIRAALAESRCKTALFDARLARLCDSLLSGRVLHNAFVEGKGQSGIPGVDSLMAGSPARETIPVPPAEAALIQMFTSGTTGQPKRIVRTHGQIMFLAEAYRSAIGGSSDDRILAVTPLSHGHGLCSGLLATLQAGATLFLQRSFDRRGTLGLLSRERITFFSAVPFVFSVLADTRMVHPVDLSAIRLCITGGAPLRRETWVKVRDRLGISLRQSYGTVETGALTINMDPDPEATSESVGHPLKGVRLAILDDAGTPLPSGTVGEVSVQSPAAGSYCEPDDSPALKEVDGWIRTNDLGFLDEQGRLYITGRKERIINVAGRKVLPREVEAVLDRHPAVQQAVVVPHRDAYGEEAVKALVVTRFKCTPSELVEHCRAQMADYKVPRFVEFRDALP